MSLVGQFVCLLYVSLYVSCRTVCMYLVGQFVCLLYAGVEIVVVR